MSQRAVVQRIVPLVVVSSLYAVVVANNNSGFSFFSCLVLWSKNKLKENDNKNIITNSVFPCPASAWMTSFSLSLALFWELLLASLHGLMTKKRGTTAARVFGKEVFLLCWLIETSDMTITMQSIEMLKMCKFLNTKIVDVEVSKQVCTSWRIIKWTT